MVSDSEKKPLIVITNDDGIDSPGIRAAARAARKFGDVLVSVPIRQYTSMARAFPKEADLGIIEEREMDLGDDVIKVYGIHGSPAYSAAFGILEIADRKPDLLVSGINIGANVGLTITCSGTIGACFEADSHNIPSLAMSLERPASEIHDVGNSADFSSAEKATAYWIEKILQEGMPKDCNILNVNVPYGEVAPDDYRFTVMDRSNYYCMVTPSKDRDFSKPCTPACSIRFDDEELFEDGDVKAMAVDKVISVTPLGWDLTKR